MEGPGGGQQVVPHSTFLWLIKSQGATTFITLPDPDLGSKGDKGMEKFLTGSKSLWHPHCSHLHPFCPSSLWINMFLIPRPPPGTVPASSPMLPSVPQAGARGEKEILLGTLM